MALDSVETLQQLIQTPSVNPMGRPLTEPSHGESRVTDLLQAHCERLGWPWLRQRVHADRDNLVAVVPGNPLPEDGGELLLWDVHQDTVPVDGMTVDPFGGEVRDGRIYGRGACDVKGSMAAMLAALSRVDEVGVKRPTIVIAFVVNEECGFTGVRALCNLWNSKSRDECEITGGTITPAKLFSRAPDAAIVAEPTQFNVVVSHQGAVRWRCHTVGRAAHTSRPDVGVNAIYAMAQIVQAVEHYHVKLSQTAHEHPLCGRPSVCVSTIRGGVGINTVPERATIEIDRRLGPEEKPEVAYNDLIRYVTEHADVGHGRAEHDPPFMDSSGLSDKQNRPFAEGVAKLVCESGRSSELVGVPFGTDAAALSAAGVPTIVFGPGSIAQAHTADEFIEIEELQFATEIFHRIAIGALNIAE
jgi:acetylornithine deacetylase/succinyl-diaminopimelate desuccinylase-like protein